MIVSNTDSLTAQAIVLNEPGDLGLQVVPLVSPTEDDVVVEMMWSGISTGTERLLWSGRMPDFPGMGYPLIPGYESVGRVVKAGSGASRDEGDVVFVPGARCFGDIRGLFGGAASTVVVPGGKTHRLPDLLGDKSVLVALAATAHHALTLPGAQMPDLVVGHGVLGRLMARLVALLSDRAPTVWENNPLRQAGAMGYDVVSPAEDNHATYNSIVDASGDPAILDCLISRLAKGGEIILAGFYDKPLQFAFPPAFMREAHIRVSAEWTPADLEAVVGLVSSGALNLDDLITHRFAPPTANQAYETAFTDPGCLKTVLDWRHLS